MIGGRIGWRALAMTTLVSALFMVTYRVEAQTERYEVDARIDRHSGTVELVERVEFDHRGGPVRLWLYTDRLAVAPRVLDQQNWRLLYPGEADRGGIEVESVSLEGISVDGSQMRIEPASNRDAAGSDLVIATERVGRLTLVLRARIRIPDRFGRLGKDGDTLSLAAPWYPLLLRDAQWRNVARHSVHVVANDGELVLGNHVFGASGSVEVDQTYVPVLSASRIHLWQGRVDGIEVAWASFEALTDEVDDEPLDDILATDRIGLMRQALEPVIGTARWLGLALPARFVLLTIPSRTELVATAPEIVLVSDRWSQVFPVDFATDFHVRALRRAFFARLVQPIVDRVDSPADRNWTEDLRSVVLLELDDARRSASGRTPQEILSAFSFHPAVDQLLYAPQIAFPDVYFSAIDEPDPFRDDPDRARDVHARGRRILESARDVLSESSFEHVLAAVAAGRVSAREALESADPRVIERLPVWLDYPNREVNYRLGTIESEPIEGGYRHRVEVFRDGATRPEPVEVEVEDALGDHVTARWDQPGERGVVEIETRGERRSVTLDPRHRLPQSAQIADGHPRGDDATDQPWRLPVLNGFALDLLASEGNVTGYIDTLLRQRYDLEHAFGFVLQRTASRTGGRLRYRQSLGAKVHNNRRSVAISGGLGFFYVSPGFGGNALGGYSTDLDVTLLIDTRSYLYDWREGSMFLAQALARATVREDGSAAVTGRASVRASTTVGIGNLNAIYLVGEGGLTIEPALDADLQSIGGRYGLRGFANEELLGQGVLYGVIEHRLTLIPDLAVNVFHLVWARELQAVWWLGAGGVFGTNDQRDAVFAFEAGAGIRVHYEYGGIQPGVLAIDLGLPVSRWLDEVPCGFSSVPDCDARFTPVSFYLSFEQYY